MPGYLFDVIMYKEMGKCMWGMHGIYDIAVNVLITRVIFIEIKLMRAKISHAYCQYSLH